MSREIAKKLVATAKELLATKTKMSQATLKEIYKKLLPGYHIRLFNGYDRRPILMVDSLSPGRSTWESKATFYFGREKDFNYNPKCPHFAIGDKAVKLDPKFDVDPSTEAEALVQAKYLTKLIKERLPLSKDLKTK